MNTKDQTINFRVDESTKQLLKDFAQELNLKESEFIRKAIVSFKDLTGQVEAAALDKEKIQELEGQIKRLSYVLETYENNEAFNKLFSQYKGHTLEGKKIHYKSDLIELLAKMAKVEVIEENPSTEGAPLMMSPIKLEAHLTPEIVEEPLTWQQVMEAVKRNWVWLVGLVGVIAVFIFWRWTTVMQKRPKIIQYSPPKAEESLLTA